MTFKTYLPIAAGILMLAGCSHSKNCGASDNCPAKAATEAVDDRDVVYTGTIPAADAAGIECTLVLDYDNATSGEYKLTEHFIDKGTFNYEGDFTIHKGTPSDASQRYMKLVPDHPDRAADQASSSDDVRYFLIDSDSTLTMTTASLQRADSGLNYTLTRK